MTISFVAPNSAFARGCALSRSRSVSLGPRRIVSPLGLSVAQRCTQLAKQTAESVMSGIGKVAEATRRAHGVAEAAIAEATSVRSQVESRIALLATQVKRMNVNAKLPVRGTPGVVGYELAMAQSIVVLAHGKVLVKIGLVMALPPDCYSRIAPRSGLALKKFIDVGAGIVDSNYREELGMILFYFGEGDFIVKMGDKIAQLIFEKIQILR